MMVRVVVERVWVVIWVVVMVGVTGSCGEEQGRDEGSREITLGIGVAASLGPYVDDFTMEYQKENPGIRFEVSAGGSNVIARQALAGAPFDIILLASSDLMDRVEEGDAILPGTRRVVGTNRLCVIIPKEGVRPNSLAELGEPGIERIAIGSPGVPAGDYARQALARSNLTGRFNNRFVFGANVRQVLAWVETGEADCGFVYISDTVGANNIRIAFIVDSTLHSPITYEGAVLQRSKHPKEARQALGSEFKIIN